MTGFFQPPAERPAGNDVSSLIRFAVELGRAIRLLFQGKMNVVTTLTLTANTGTTTFSDSRLSIDSFVALDPLTANAAAELAAGTVYALQANRNNQTWTFTHANAATTDRTFRVVILG